MRVFAGGVVAAVVGAALWLVGAFTASQAAPLGGWAPSALGLAVGLLATLVVPLVLSTGVVRALADRRPRRAMLHGGALVLTNGALLGLALGVWPDPTREAVRAAGDWPLFRVGVPEAPAPAAAEPPAPEEPLTSEQPEEPVLDAAGVFAHAADSVVVVEVTTIPSGPFAFLGTLHGHGSGFAVGPDLVVTNFHVAGEARQMAVRTRDGRRLQGTLVATLASDDLVLIRVDGLELRPLGLASGEVVVGAKTWAIGAPLGFEYSLTEGIVSGTRDVAGTPFVQMQTAVAPGSSGGPLLDDRGRVVGVNTALAGPGLSLAVDVSRVRALLAMDRVDAEPVPLLPKPLTLVRLDLPEDMVPTERQQVEQLVQTLVAGLTDQVSLQGETGTLQLAARDCRATGLVGSCADLQRSLGWFTQMIRLLGAETVRAELAEVPRAEGGTGSLVVELYGEGLPAVADASGE